MQSQALLTELAQQLKVPLMQIARRAELMSLGHNVDPLTLQATAEAAMQLTDSYVLGVKLAQDGQQSLSLEPVTVASVLYDTAHQLSAIAKFYGVSLELSIHGKQETVLTNRESLQSALTSLGMALIEALPGLDAKQLTLQLGSHRSRYGIVTGVYSDTQIVSRQNLRQGRTLHGNSRQPLVASSHANGAGIFLADTILKGMGLDLTTTRHHRWYGLGAVLEPNRQLAFV